MFPSFLLDAVVEKAFEPKEYAKTIIISESTQQEWKCFNDIIYQESRWDPTVENGPFYGLGQMYDGKKYLEGKPALQVDKAIEYIDNKYESNCSALAHHEKYGWY
jgi:hypothetical protein